MSHFKRLSLLLSFFILTPVCVGCIADDKNDGIEEHILPGDQLPSLNLTLSNGAVVTDATLNGKISVIVLFSTLCSDCQRLLPDLERLYQEVIKDDDSMVLVPISRAEGDDKISAYWSGHGLTMPYSAQETKDIYNLFASSIVPRVYIADAKRTVQAVFTDAPVPSYDDLLAAIRSLK